MDLQRDCPSLSFSFFVVLFFKDIHNANSLKHLSDLENHLENNKTAVTCLNTLFPMAEVRHSQKP